MCQVLYTPKTFIVMDVMIVVINKLQVHRYVEWSYHEPEERQYMFEGDRDVARFVQIAAEEGLHVLLRPGPYICAERDLVMAYTCFLEPHRRRST